MAQSPEGPARADFHSIRTSAQDGSQLALHRFACGMWIHADSGEARTRQEAGEIAYVPVGAVRAL